MSDLYGRPTRRHRRRLATVQITKSHCRAARAYVVLSCGVASTVSLGVKPPLRDFILT